MNDTLFINLTNHPISNWSAEQIMAAKQMGRIVEIPFPVVSPESTTEEIQSLADEQVESILRVAEDARIITVHVMGELTLTYAIVTRLKTKGIRCVASTTIRNVEQMPDGRKISDFNFVQFRGY